MRPAVSQRPHGGELSQITLPTYGAETGVGTTSTGVRSRREDRAGSAQSSEAEEPVEAVVLTGSLFFSPVDGLPPDLPLPEGEEVRTSVA